MANRKELEVANVKKEFEILLSKVYGDLDTSMKTKIQELCTMAFDLSFAMYGMESRVYPEEPQIGSLFNDTEMKLSTRSDPAGLVRMVVFPAFRDSDNRLYSKSKVWCTPMEEREGVEEDAKDEDAKEAKEEDAKEAKEEDTEEAKEEAL